MLLKDRVAIITGGARGIGKGITLKLAEEGCTTVIADLTVGAAESAITDVKKGGGEALFVQCDVTNTIQVDTMVCQTVSRFGRIDILVNNAGVATEPKFFVEVSDEEWDKVLNVNLKAAFLCSRSVTPYMKEKGYGKIVNISSIGALNPPVPSITYAASKAGLLGLTVDLALELARFNICVNVVLPGLVDTPLWDSVIPPGTDRSTFFSAAANALSIPLERVGTPEDVGNVVLFLASELSAYITGERISVTGGHPYRFMPE